MRTQIPITHERTDDIPVIIAFLLKIVVFLRGAGT
jgi:hypothetical protein